MLSTTTDSHSLLSKLKDKSLLAPGACIGGRWVPVSNGCPHFDVLDPATSKCIARLPDLGPSACDESIAVAQGALKKLGQLSGKARGTLLTRWYSLILEAAEDLAAIITAENGKVLGEARGEIQYAADFVSWFAGEAMRISGNVCQGSSSDNRVVTIKQPVGIVSVITPWNFPAAMITRKVGAALAAGCPCIVKPAADTPLTALALAALADRAGFPVGSVSIVTTLLHTVAVGKVLTQHPEIRKFSFTGSSAVGKILAAQCTSTVKRISLELGGNAPFIVFDDADIAKAVDAILASKFRLTGQTCVCANRVYVQEHIYDTIATALADKIRDFHIGPGTNSTSTHGPLINHAAVKKVQQHVEDALSRGAAAVVGGKAAEALGAAFFEPTLLVNVSSDSLCAREETFGPLLPLIRFDTEQSVLKLANDTPFGLAGYLFTKDLSRAWRVGEKLEVGMIGLNTGLISDVFSPFGGIKESGIGREGSSLGIEEYLEMKSMTFAIDE